MKASVVALVLIALTGTACSRSDSGAAPAAGSALGETECRAVVDRSRELQGIPADAFVDAAEQTIRSCAAGGGLDQAGYDCAMNASDIDAFQACGIDLS